MSKEATPRNSAPRKSASRKSVPARKTASRETIAEPKRPRKTRRTTKPKPPTATEQLVPRRWYWVRRKDGSLAPYVFHRQSTDPKTGRLVGEFFVGSFIVTFGLNQVVGEAHMPRGASDNAK